MSTLSARFSVRLKGANWLVFPGTLRLGIFTHPISPPGGNRLRAVWHQRWCARLTAAKLVREQARYEGRMLSFDTIHDYWKIVSAKGSALMPRLFHRIAAE